MRSQKKGVPKVTNKEIEERTGYSNGTVKNYAREVRKMLKGQ